MATVLLRKTMLLVLLLGFFAFRAEGQQWEQFDWPHNPLNSLVQLEALQSNVYIVGYQGVYRSTDGGEHWQVVFNYFLQDNYTHRLFVDRANNRLYFNAGIDSSGFFALYRSDNLGSSWTKVGNLKSAPKAFIGDTLYGGGQAGIKLSRKVGTNPWVNMDTWPGTAGTVYSLCAVDKHLWVATQTGVYHSPDAGYTWSLSLPLNNTPVGMQALHQEVVVVTTQSLYFTKDYGDNWQEIPWSAYGLYNTGQHLFARDGDTKLLQFNGGNAQNWETQDLQAQDTVEVYGIGETYGTFWLGTYPYAVVRKRPNDLRWEPYNGDLNNQPHNFWYWEDHLFVDNNMVQTFSTDHGNTWHQRLNANNPVDTWSNGNYDYQSGYDFYDYESIILRCLRNDRFEWAEYVGLPDYVDQVAANGDTLLAIQTYPPKNFFRSFDNGQNWATVTNTLQVPIKSFQGKFYARKGNALYRSDDVGSTWQVAHTFPTTIDNTVSGSVLFLEHDTMFIPYPPGYLTYYSTDGGQTFDTLPTPPVAGSSVYRLRAHNGALMMVTGDSAFVYFSRDLGQHWITLPLPHVVTNWSQDLALINQWTIDKNILIFGGGYRYHFDGKRQVNGQVFLDLNSNGVKDPGELGLNGQVIKNSQGQAVGVTYGQGNFSVLLPMVADTLRLDHVPDHFTANPGVQAIPPDATPTVNFPLQPQGAIEDMAIHLAAVAPYKAGFPNTLYLDVENLGAQPATGEVKLRLDPLLAILDAQPNADEQIGDTLVWHYANLYPLLKKQFQVQVQTANVTPGTLADLYAEASITSDVDPTNNAVHLQETILASYDPNAKTVSETELPADSADGHELIYAIRFQNLGNAPTDFITVRDTLASGLDAASVRVLTASHPFEWRLEGSNVLVFRFSPIILSPAATDSLNSQGFVQFAVKLRTGLEVGDEIANTAHIYFDFNPAIVTNTVATTIQVVSTFAPTEASNRLHIFPNPAHDRVTLQLPNNKAGDGWIEIFSTAGRLVHRISTQAGHSMMTLELSGWSPGTYWCRWVTGDAMYWGKIIMSK